MNKYIVRVVHGRKRRNVWFVPTDYVGCYVAVSAVAALTIAGNDPYMREVMTKRTVRVEAVEANDLTVQAVRDEWGLWDINDYPNSPSYAA